MSAPLEPRIRRRRRLLWGTLLPAIVLIVLAVRFLTLPVNMGAAQEAHGTDDGPGVVEAGERLGILNIVERWRAPFVEGTGKSMSGDLVDGRKLLEEALGRTSTAEDDCTVRTNLVITISEQADEAEEQGDADAKEKFAKEGLKVIEGAPEGCLNGQDDGNGGEAGRKMREQKKKLEEQSGQQQQDDGGDGQKKDQQDQADDGDEGKDPKRKKLEERNQQGQQKSQEERRDAEGTEDGLGPGVEKPW